MTKRKDRLKELFTGEKPSQEEARAGGEVTPPAPTSRHVPASASGAPAADVDAGREAMQFPAPGLSPRSAPRAASGAVKAMGLSLGQIAEDADEARRLREAAGEQIISLDPALIDSAMIADRLSAGADNDQTFEMLKESLRESGQQVPVLVRPHPDDAKRRQGWYQTAYGHRRIRAARELDIQVKAIVRPLTDDALVLAQGKENAERRDLSFIERAFFAKGLIDHGFERATAQAALGAHKSEMTRLLQVADRIPIRIARAVGPAPKAGRPRWLALGDLLAHAANVEKAGDETSKKTFMKADSDQRFQLLFDRLSKPKAAPKPLAIKAGDGRVMAEMKGRVVTLSKNVPDGFSDYLASELPGLLAAFAEDGKS